MKDTEKREILILIIVAIIIIGIIIFVKNSKNEEENVKVNNAVVEEFVDILQDGTKLNTSDELKKPKKIDGLEIANIQLTEKNGQTVLLADVKNTTEKDTSVIGIYVVILDKQGKEIAKIPGAISPLKVGETKQLNVGITENYVNSYNFRIEKQ